MDITRKTDYAIRMLTALAEAGDGCPISVRELADRQGVPYAFARAVQRELAAAGLVTTTRGTTGGLCLARPAQQVTLLDVVTAMQGTPSIAVCANDPKWCERAGSCRTHQVWREVDAAVQDVLGKRTLAGLTTMQGR